jgi:hypothetical protein
LAKDHDKLQYFGQKRLKTLLKMKNVLVKGPKRKKDLEKGHDRLQYFGQKRLKTLLKEKNALVRAPKGRKI